MLNYFDFYLTDTASVRAFYALACAMCNDSDGDPIKRALLPQDPTSFVLTFDLHYDRDNRNAWGFVRCNRPFATELLSVLFLNSTYDLYDNVRYLDFFTSPSKEPYTKNYRPITDLPFSVSGLDLLGLPGPSPLSTYASFWDDLDYIRQEALSLYENVLDSFYDYIWEVME